MTEALQEEDDSEDMMETEAVSKSKRKARIQTCRKTKLTAGSMVRKMEG